MWSREQTWSLDVEGSKLVSTLCHLVLLLLLGSSTTADRALLPSTRPTDPSRRAQRTRRGLEASHLEGLGFDDLDARAAGDGRDAARDGVDAVEGTREDEVFVRGEVCLSNEG